MQRLRGLPRPPRRRLPEDLNLGRPRTALAHARDLLARPLATPGELAAWLEERAEYEAAVEEVLLLARLDLSDQVADAQRHGWLTDLHQELGAPLADLRHRLDRKAWEASGRDGLPGATDWPVLARRMELHRESNLVLQERLQVLETEYLLLAGNLAIRRSGRSCPLSEMRHLLSGVDPVARRQVWEERAALLEELRPTFEDLIDEMLALREQVARNADQPSWNALRAAGGQGGVAWRPEDLVAGAEPMVGRPWDMAACAEGCGGRFAGTADLVAELTDGLSYLAPALALTLRKLTTLGLLDIESHPGKFDLDACLWLPERRLPILRMNAHALEDDLCRFVRHLAEAGLALAEDATRRREGVLVLPDRRAVAQARQAVQAVVGGLEPAAARCVAERTRLLRQQEARLALAREYWMWLLHENPGMGRTQRRRLWRATLRLIYPGLAADREGPELEDTLFLEAAFFLPDWTPPSLARHLMEGAAR
ncbi:MAG: hypothetical protein Q8O14_11035 [bacterium]|nr:hypothetical protein [bacterium]